MRRPLGLAGHTRLWPSHGNVMMDDVEDYISAMECSSGTRSVLHSLVLCLGPKMALSGQKMTQNGLK